MVGGFIGRGKQPFRGRAKISPESGWIATISKPRFTASIKLESWGDQTWSQP
jgi:hypothetical protein